MMEAYCSGQPEVDKALKNVLQE